MALNLSGTSGITGAGIGTIGPSGANVTGVVTCTSVVSSGTISGTTITATADVTLGDSNKLRLGAEPDLDIYHSGNNAFFENTTGNVYFRNDGATTYFQMGSANDSAIALSKDGPVLLYYDSSEKMRTTSDGIFVKNSIKIEEASGSEYYLIATNSYGGLEFQNETTKIAEFTDASTLELQDNLKFAVAGKGIDFSITSDAGGMASELLDDYEEGTWTPVPTFGDGNTGAAYSGTGTYIKAGRIVTAAWNIVFTAKGSSTGQFQITGLPFTPSRSGQGTALGYIHRVYTNYAGQLCAYTSGTTLWFGSSGIDGNFVNWDNDDLRNDTALQGVTTFIAV